MGFLEDQVLEPLLIYRNPLIIADGNFLLEAGIQFLNKMELLLTEE